MNLRIKQNKDADDRFYIVNEGYHEYLRKDGKFHKTTFDHSMNEGYWDTYAEADVFLMDWKNKNESF